MPRRCKTFGHGSGPAILGLQKPVMETVGHPLWFPAGTANLVELAQASSALDPGVIALNSHSRLRSARLLGNDLDA